MERPRKPDPIIRGVCEASPPDIGESTAEVHQASFRNWKSPRQLGLSTLKARRERGDMIRNLQHHNWQVWCRQEHLVYTTGTQEGADSTRATSGHLNLKRREAKQEIRSHQFSIKMVPLWYFLPDHVKNQETLKSFKNAYDNRVQTKLSSGRSWTILTGGWELLLFISIIWHYCYFALFCH